jgi:hypothetical protein
MPSRKREMLEFERSIQIIRCGELTSEEVTDLLQDRSYRPVARQKLQTRCKTEVTDPLQDRSYRPVARQKLQTCCKTEHNELH